MTKGIYNPPGHPISVTSGPSHVVPAKIPTGGRLNYKNVGVQARSRKGGGVRGGPTRMNVSNVGARGR
jgi:hypothetical protein